MKWLFAPPDLDDLIRLLRAWRFWILAALVGAAVGAAVYFLAPPAYRTRATVHVDFHLEQAWPQETDRQQFYYLERETRKLEEIAWSDAVMQAVSADSGIPVRQLRDDKLQLSQPGQGGWHFYADDRKAEVSSKLASAWAQAFTTAAAQAVSSSTGPDRFIEVTPVQVEHLSPKRSISLGAYLLAGTILAWLLGAFVFLFFDFGANGKAKE